MLIDRVVIFNQKQPGQRQPTSLRDVSHERFREWAEEYLARTGIRYQHGTLETKATEREAMLLKMLEWNIAPAMLSE